MLLQDIFNDGFRTTSHWNFLLNFGKLALLAKEQAAEGLPPAIRTALLIERLSYDVMVSHNEEFVNKICTKNQALVRLHSFWGSNCKP